MTKQTIKIQKIALFFLTLLLFMVCFIDMSGAKADENAPMTVNMQVVNKKDIESLVLTASLGEPVAIYNLAHNYHHGTDTKIDLVKARVWYEKAAKTESPEVRYKIGRMFETGTIFDKDINKALEHYIFSAEGNDINAQANLGAIFLSKKDKIEQGLLWSKKAADKNSVQAQVNLAVAYQRGLAGKVNIAEAIYWFKAAAANSNTFSQHQLGLYYYSIKNHTEAFYWFDLASELKNANSMLYLSMMFDKGQGIEKNREKSITLLKAAAEQGNEKAKALLKQLGAQN